MIALHNHTTRCNHASGEMEEYVLAAKKAGITEFGFSDHSHWMLSTIAFRTAMLKEELPDYVAEVYALQKKHNQEGENPFHVRLGLEMDFMPSRMAEALETISAYQWDYLIGSIHNIGFEELQSYPMYEEWATDDIYELYFYQTHEMIKARFGDMVGHIDVPKKRGKYPNKPMTYYIEPLLSDLRNSEMTVEINTSGLDSKGGEFMPGWAVVEQLHQAGVRLTISSDSHAPSQVGRHYDQLFSGLRARNIKELWYFVGREARVIKVL